MQTRYTIMDRLMLVVGLFESVYGKLTDLIVYDNDKEKGKRILKEVYHKTDVDSLFPPELDEQRFDRVSTILFQYYWQDGREQQHR